MGSGWKEFVLEVVPFLPSCGDDRLARRELRLVGAAAAKVAREGEGRGGGGGGGICLVSRVTSV